MNTLDHAVGLNPAMIAALVAALAVLLWTYIVRFRIGGPFRLVPASAVGLSVFAMVFAIANPLLQIQDLTVAAIRSDLTSGLASLRVSSVVLGIRVIWLSLHIVLIEEGSRHLFGNRVERSIANRLQTRDSEFSEINDLPEMMECSQRDYFAATQYGFFLIALTLLWIFSAFGISTALTVFMNLTLFFFVDDWVIISHYTNAFRGRTLRSHNRTVVVADLLLMPAVLVASYLYLPWFVAVPATVVIAVLLLIQIVMRG